MVSVILPVYNRQQELPDCLRSLRGQSYQDFEVLIVDDGSTDDSVAVCQRFVDKDARFKLFTAAHSGVSAARNIALEQASGDLIFFVDSDDAIHPLLMETLVNALINSDASIATAHRTFINNKNWRYLGQLIAEYPGPGKVTYRSNKDALHAMFYERSPINIIGGLMMKRNLIGDTRFPVDIFISEDFYFIYQNMLKGPSIALIEQCWYYVRNHDNNISNNYHFSGFYTRFSRRKLVWENEEALGRTEYANRQKKNAFFVYQKCLWVNNASAEDIKKMQKVMKDHKKALRSGLTLIGKLQLELYIPFPALCRLVRKIKKR